MKLTNKFSWIGNTPSPYGDVIINTVLRWGRNLKNYSFPDQMTSEEAHSVGELVAKGLSGQSEMGSLDDVLALKGQERSLLRERYQIEETLSPQEGQFISISRDESSLLLVNFKEHFQILHRQSGFDAPALENFFYKHEEYWQKQLPWSFDAEWGFLSSRVSQSGTNLEISLLMHLPALSRRKDFDHLLLKIADQGVRVRGFLSEEDSNRSSLYILSNEYTMGVSEEETFRAMAQVAEDLNRIELKERQQLLEGNRLFWEDRIYRSLGICKTARVMEKLEGEEHILNLRLGSTWKLIKNDAKIWDRALYLIQENHIALEKETEVDLEVNKMNRARLLRSMTMDIELP